MMPFMNARRLPLLVVLLLLGPAAVDAEDVKVLKGRQWKTRKARTVAELDGFEFGPSDARTPYGGSATGPRARGRRYFSRRKFAGRWWLVDPDGRPFLTVGLNSVHPRDFAADAIPKRFGSSMAWARATATLLRANGFNTLGCWSDWWPFREDDLSRMPYTRRWNFMATYKQRRPKPNGPAGFPNETMPVFDPQFETFCAEHAKQLSETAEDPWLLGHFSDNELPFRPDALDRYLALGKADPGRKATARWWRKRIGRNERAITTKDRDAFLEFLGRRYYSVVAKAIKTRDPNHLYLGSRIHGRTIRLPLFRAARGHVDVMSVNYYHRWSAERGRMTRWVEAFQGPFLVSEWYAQSVKSRKTSATGAGFRVQTNAARGRFYQNLALGLLEHPGCVGWHWFKYGGDGEGFRKGIVSRALKPHSELLGRMAELNQRVYALAAHFARETGDR
jgi:hypothetical protein